MKTTLVGLTGILMGNLLALVPVAWPTGRIVFRSVGADTMDKPQEQPASETARREWALGCAAVLTERNHESHILLGGCIPGETTKADMRRRLSDGWGINSRAELFQTLDAIDTGGHRAGFAKAGLLVSLLSETQFQALLRKADNPEAANSLRVVRRYHKQLGDKSIYGWDYIRAICLCRWAYVAGYINEGEAWQRILPMARLLQKKFDSWDDLGRNYLIGRQFWSYKETQENGWRFEDAVQRLLDMRSSPWNRYPWDMNLQDGGKQESVPREEPQEKPQEHEKGKEVIAALW